MNYWVQKPKSLNPINSKQNNNNNNNEEEEEEPLHILKMYGLKNG